MFVMPRGVGLSALRQMVGVRPEQVRASAGTAALPSRDTMMQGLQRAASDPVDLTKKLTAGALRQGKKASGAGRDGMVNPAGARTDALAAQRMRAARPGAGA